MGWRWIVGVGVALVSGRANAAPVVIEMNAASDLELEGFEHNSDAGTSVFDAGTMIVDTVGFEEWMLAYPTPSKWWDHVHPSKGWWVEARVRVDEADPACADGPGIWIHDRGKLFKLFFGATGIHVFPRGEAAVDTSVFHVYRVEDYGEGGSRRVLVDGAEVIDLTNVAGGAGSMTLMIGDLGGCGHSVVVWDSFSYDTFAPGAEEDDADGDGIANAVDNCWEVPNADQANQDADGAGDVCDPCPVDVLDDSDLDGVCDSDDACPDDPTASEEPCPTGESGFMGDGFGDEGPLDGTGDAGSASADGSASASASVTASAGDGGSATADDGTGSGAGSGERDDGGCSCRSDRGPPALTWLLLFAVPCMRPRAPRRSARR